MSQPRSSGRPPRGPQSATALIQMRVQPDVKAKWQAAASRAGMTLSQWISDVANREAIRATNPASSFVQSLLDKP